MFSFSRVVRGVLGLAMTAAVVYAPAPAMADGAWPNRPVTIVVPFSPGGSTDVVARLLAKELGKIWGQSVMVENRAGAGGNLGASMVAKSPADGYTLFLTAGAVFTVNPHLYSKLGFDVKRDFTPITQVATGPMLVVVPASETAASLRDLVAKAKAKPGGLNFGSAGNGSQVHMAAEKLATAAEIEIEHVPYKGEAPAYTDLIAGQTNLVVGNIAASSAFVRDHRLRALAVTGKERSPLLPDVPTVAEAGFPAAESLGWFGLFGPAGLPKEVIDKVLKDTIAALGTTEIKSRLDGYGMVAVGNQPLDLVKFMDEESRSWAGVVKARKLSAN
jgi:tripartite-type tricarboxylate transporter receptor subunit TctC